MTRIVTYVHRYKRPPPKRKPAPLVGPVIVRKQGKADATPPRPAEEPTPAQPPAPGARKSAIITIKRKNLPPGLLAETPEEHRRRGDAADALWRELVRRSTAGK